MQAIEPSTGEILKLLNGISMEVYEEIKSLELELVSPDVRRNVARLSELIDDDFEEFGSSGTVFRKHDILSLLPQAENAEYELSNFTFKELSKGCILVKYRSLVSGKYALRSSIWVNHSSQWQMLHHQSTVVPNAL